MGAKKQTATHSATPREESDISEFIRNVRLTGRANGLVKNLRGFKKSHHSIPDAVNSATSAFLGKLCASELAEEAEAFFQKARTRFSYKRKDIALDVSSPTAILTARDFTLEWAYALDENAPEVWTLTHTLHHVNGASLNDANALIFDELFSSMFDTIVFSLTKGARVETVIDAIESLDADESPKTDSVGAPPEPALHVEYPSDCRHCILRVEGVPAEVVFDGSELSMVFPKAGTPHELIDAFVEVRRAFALARNRATALACLL